MLDREDENMLTIKRLGTNKKMGWFECMLYLVIASAHLAYMISTTPQLKLGAFCCHLNIHFYHGPNNLLTCESNLQLFTTLCTQPDHQFFAVD